MGEDVRVVLRSPWGADVLITAPFALVLLGLILWWGAIASTVTAAVVDRKSVV